MFFPCLCVGTHPTLLACARYLGVSPGSALIKLRALAYEVHFLAFGQVLSPGHFLF